MGPTNAWRALYFKRSDQSVSDRAVSGAFVGAVCQSRYISRTWYLVRQCRGTESGGANLWIQPYSYLSATTGSSFAAFAAGSIPNSTPVTQLVASAATTASGGTLAATGVTALIRNAAPVPKTRPMIAPIPVNVTASTRNCQRIVARVAPSAFRTPISRVRSVTEIIMIAMTPTPPTIRPTADNTTMTRKKAPKILL